MGTWGVKIEENDTYLDIEKEFLDLYNDKVSLDKIYEKFIKEEDFNDISEETHDFWFAIAHLLWQCKYLDERVYKVVKEIIETKKDIEYWKELDAENNDILEREKYLNEFLKKISKPKKRARRRVKKVLFNSIFDKGDCLIYKLKNGNYGGALVIENEKKTELGLNTIVISNINQKKVPKLNDFRKAKVQYVKQSTLVDYHFEPFIAFFYGIYYEEEKNEMGIKIIGNLKIKHTDLNKSPKMGGMWSIMKTWGNNSYSNEIKDQLKLNYFIEDDRTLIDKIIDWLQ